MAGRPSNGTHHEDQSAAPHVVVMGRVTFEALAAISRRNDDDAARRLTELPKLVVSTTLREPLGWSNARVVASLEELRALKEGDGDPLRCIGSLSLVRSLLELGLLDRLRLVVFPQILGATGRERILAGLPDIDLELAGEEVLDGRLVVLDYRPAGLSAA